MMWIFEARKKAGGLNEFGIAAYKTVDDFAARKWVRARSGGIAVKTGKAFGKGLKLKDLQRDFDAVFLGMGLQGVNVLGAKHEDADGIEDAVNYIAELRRQRISANCPWAAVCW
jgi:glutamate synthase (NADPH/NADH) small chain